ncbi:hypothetical protein CONLIGDRAFT_78598 [Coniochaeta ligniaria NRRL 30616]|uniref:DUF7918 domain-containing protein n=1 Tax=Coniochaeta ligniaria NRRL 30616 TaxID=1408157 RepID=A0A1J7IC68_9PEZI|nr:hypothetical protein CONLIGDRAFT_78598 [Coniochaeta ligniaria NRRL 30616]
MPCYKGIAVSIHANGSPLPEYGIQKQSRVSRINTYIPVPQPQLNPDSNKPEPAKFAVSITLLTPGLAIPYSTPKATEANPYPKPQHVGTLPTGTGERGKYHGVVNPYIPMTNNENETIAAYIYFDGRAKEEVATLLRPGEETWVNSRWVQVPLSEGGGLAEREFLFREVGLDRWLKGLDLAGDVTDEKLERRRQKFEKRRRRQKSVVAGGEASSAPEIKIEEGMEIEGEGSSHAAKTRDTLRYGDATSPVEAVFEDDTDSSSDDEPPETAGQIKVAMFRVIASGEIKKGEYSPQFDAHDDDDEEGGGAKSAENGGGIDADVEHTTSFAKPKSLDPKTISTQTVTGIDGPDKPYATFTFFYRGDRESLFLFSTLSDLYQPTNDVFSTGQLQKMGILPSSKAQPATPASIKRRSGQLDFSNLGPLKTSGTVGFSTFRDHNDEPRRKKKNRSKSNGSAVIDEDSDEDDDDDHEIMLGKMEDVDDKEDKSRLGPEDAKFSGELADGVKRIKLKRAHSADPESASIGSRKSPSAGPFAGETTPPDSGAAAGKAAVPPLSGASLFGKSWENDAAAAVVGSPMKKARPSIAGLDDVNGGASSSYPQLGDVLAKAEAAQAAQAGKVVQQEVKAPVEAPHAGGEMEEEEL